MLNHMRQNPHHTNLLCLTIFSLFVFVAHAQKSPQQLQRMREDLLKDDKVETVGISPTRQTPDFIKLKTTTKLKKETAKPTLVNYLKLRNGVDELVEMKGIQSSTAESVVKYQQYFKGLKVDRASYGAFIKNGMVNFYNGAYYEIPATVSVTPSISMAKAVDFARKHIGAKKYVADEIKNAIAASKNAAQKKSLQMELLEAAPKGELLMINDFSKPGSNNVRLAYKLNIYAAEPLSRSWVYVDAMNGDILLTDAIIKHVNDPKTPAANTGITSVATTVQTRYAGSRSIQVKQISGNDPNSGLPLVASNPLEIYIPGSATYVLIDDTRGNGIETYDLNGIGGLPISLPVYSQAKSFTDVNNNWLLSEHKRGGAVESENDDFGWDAHWGAGLVYDYWKLNQNRLSYDGNNAKIKSYIHSGIAYDNAFWNGSVMTYGDGSGTAAMGFRPLTSLDVCGHEIGHGVCEFTSNLVYAKESGAMNEGLSDIWAACIEYFAIKKVDPSLVSVYKPFYIGEQISASPATPLRRMDDPKAQGNPDTYGGVNWTSQNCTPSLANDQCGVHNNSGVLNKWFYLLTVGSGAGSGPDAAYAGVDDGINDAVTTGPVADQHPANPYSVTGIGFTLAEKITFLTEQLLSSFATYAEARQVSIAVATDLSGDGCGAIVEAVTNAWYAVGVGPKFVKPCSITYGFVFQPGAAVNEAAIPSGCVSSKVFNIPVFLPASSTATIALTGTATRNIDYSLTTTSLSNTATISAKQNIAVTILNDGATEANEEIILTLTVTNIGTNKVNKTYKVTLLDDDVVPAIGVGQKTLLNETFTRADGFTDPGGWTEKLEIPEAPNGDPLATGKNQWGIFDNKLAITGKEGLTGTQLPNGTYNSNSESQTIIKSGLIDARGLSVINLKFDLNIQGEIDAQGTDPENFPAFDYMAIAYSLDNINYIELNTGAFRQYASLQPTTITVNGPLPASLVNKQFYIAFRWKNDANAGGPMSAGIDNLLITGAPRTLENDLNHNGRENLNAGQDAYFYSIQDGQILARLKNGSTKTFGCSNIFVEKTGAGAFNLYQGGGALHKVSDKIVRIETGVSFSAPNVVTLFYTENQLVGLEQATGKARTTFNVYLVTGIAYTTSTAQNTKRYEAAYTALPGVGGFYTLTFIGIVNGSYALGAPVSTIVRSIASPSISSATTKKFESIYPNPSKNMVYIRISLPANEKLKLDILSAAGQLLYTQRNEVAAGTSLVALPVSTLKKGSYSVSIKDEKGTIINTQQFIKE